MAMESLEEQLIQGVKKEISSFDKYADEGKKLRTQARAHFRSPPKTTLWIADVVTSSS